MKNKLFNQLVEECIDVIRESLSSKGDEYAMENPDRLCNFKRAAAIEKTIPERALVGMWVKHLVSILDIIDRLEAENKRVGLQFNAVPEFLTKELLEEKIKDIVNYPIILKALLKERYGYEIRKRTDLDSGSLSDS